MRDIPALWRGFSFSLLPMAQSAVEGEAFVLPGGTLVVTGVPDPYLNWGFLYGPDDPSSALAAFVARLRTRTLPGVFMAASPIAQRLEKTVRQLGLSPIEPKPIMLAARDAALQHASGMRFSVERIEDDAVFAEAMRVSGEAWETPPEVMARAYRPQLFGLPDVELYVALLQDEIASYVCSVRVGDVVWIGDLGTAPQQRGKGAATTLLADVMRSYRARGHGTFGLCADAGAIRLYERLGFETVDKAPMWVCT